MDEKTINFYDHNAEKYSKWRSDQSPDQAQKVFLQNTKPGGYILDLGCGTGEKSLWFRDNGLNVKAVDASEEMLKFLNNAQGVFCSQMDITRLEHEEKFDGIWASFSIQHLKINEQNELLKKIPKTLNKGGIFYLGMHEGSQSYRDQLGRLYVPRSEKDLRAIFSFNRLSIFEFFREKSSSFDGEPIEVLHLFARQNT